jgi:lysozyme family protein
LIGVEGGRVNDPLDRGGETKYGVSLRFLAAEGALTMMATARPIMTWTWTATSMAPTFAS